MKLLLQLFAAIAMLAPATGSAQIQPEDIFGEILRRIPGPDRDDHRRPGPRRPRPRPRIQHICGHKPDQFVVDSITCNANNGWASGVQIDINKNDADIAYVEVTFSDGYRERLHRMNGRYRAGERAFDYFRSGRVVNVTVGATSPNLLGKSKLEIYLVQ